MASYMQRQSFLFFRGWGLKSRIVLATVIFPATFFLLFLSHPLRSVRKMLDQDVKRMLPELIQHLEWHYQEVILDYGCGDGRTGNSMILPEVIKWNSQLYSVDLVKSNVEVANTRYPHEKVVYGQGSLLGEHGTYSEFPWPYLRFDKIFAIYVFHFIYDLPKALERFHRALKPGGQLAFTSLTLQNWAFSVCLQLSKLTKWRPYMINYETRFHPSWAQFQDNVDANKTVRSMLHDKGFHVDHLRVDEFQVYSHDTSSFLDRFTKLSPAFAEIPKEKLPRLREDVGLFFNRVTGIPLDAKGFNITYQYIVGVARKKF